MKALSVGLVKGSIDEVDKRVHMTWVQPRVLDLQQVITVAEISVQHSPFKAWHGILVKNSFLRRKGVVSLINHTALICFPLLQCRNSFIRSHVEFMTH